MEHGDVDSPSAGSGVDAAPADLDGGLVFDQALAAAVNDALIGDVLADLPEAQPTRELHSATDFSSLYVRHRSGLAAHARRFLRDSRDVDEVVQETFLRLFLAISEIETEMQAIAFARRTLTNLCIDRYRADRRRPTLITLDASPLDMSDGDDLPDPVLQAEDAAIVREALSRLSPIHRAALVKREIEEKPLPQIAAELGIAEDSVKHLLFRARRALRRLLIGTSVEPGADLTGEGAEPGGNPLVRGATVFVLFLVGALVLGTGIRPLFSGGAKPQPATSAIGGIDIIAGHGMPNEPVRRATHRHATPRRVPAAGTSATAPVLPDSSLGVASGLRATPRKTNRPVHHAPVAFGSRGHFRLSGQGLTVTGVPEVSQGGVASSGAGDRTAASSFTAPTDQGTFELNQTVMTSSSGGSTVTVSPAFVVGGAVQQPTLNGTSAALGTDAAGNVTVDLSVSAQPDSSGNSFPLTSLTAQLVLTPDLARVLSETVTLTTQPQQQPAPVSAGSSSPPPSSGGGSVGTGGTQSGTGTGTGTGSGSTGTSGSGTSSGTSSGTGGSTTPDCPAAGPGTTSPPAATTGTSDPSACQPADTGSNDTAGSGPVAGSVQ